MSRKILGIVAGVLVATFATVAVFAGPAATKPEVPTVADQHIGDSVPEAVSLLPEEGNPFGAPGGVVEGNGPREVLGVPTDNTHPCDKFTGGCGTVANPGDPQTPEGGGTPSHTINLPQPAVDGIANAVAKREAAGTQSGPPEAHGKPADVPRGGGMPADVPRGGPGAS